MNQTLHDQSVVSTTDSAASDLRLMSANFGRRSAICEQRRARSGGIGRATLEGPMGFWQRKKVGKWYWKTRRENFRGNYYWNEKKKKKGKVHRRFFPTASLLPRLSLVFNYTFVYFSTLLLISDHLLCFRSFVFSRRLSAIKLSDTCF